MEILIAFYVFFFGLIIGSFLNVVIYRFNSGVTLGGRSHCAVCDKTLEWYELVPLVSFIALKGKCSECKTKISWQYPLVEFATGLLFVLAYMVFGFSSSLPLILLFLSVAIVITVYDLKHKIIPDRLTLLLLATAVSERIVFYVSSRTSPTLLDLAAPFIFFFPFWAIWYFSKGAVMGLGDGKLVFVIGALLGLVSGVSAIVLAFWIGAIVGVILMLISRLRLGNARITMKSELPFAPFLILGCLIVLFSRIDVTGLGILLSVY